MFQRFLFLMLSTLLLGGGTYWLLTKIRQNRLEFIFAIKSVDQTPCKLVLQGRQAGRSYSDTIEQTLQPIQFFMPLQFSGRDGEGLERILFLPEKDSTTIYLESLRIVRYHQSVASTVYSWQSSDSLSKFINHISGCRLIDHTPNYLEISTDGGTGCIELNAASILEKQAIENPAASRFSLGWLALFIGLFVSLVLLPPKAILNPCRMPSAWRELTPLVRIFFMTLLVVLLNSLFRIIPDMTNREKRALSAMPSLTSDNVLSYTDEVSKFLSDQFAFRNFFFYCNSLVHTTLLRESAIPSKVIQGSHGWFYYNDEGSIADYRRMSKIDSNLVSYGHHNFATRIDWLQQRGIKFYMMVPPNKERIYPDYMPSRFRPVDGIGHNSLDFFKKMLDQSGVVHIIDPTDSLLVARRRRYVYYKTDTHWNTYGGFIGYQALMKAIAKDFPVLKPFREDEFLFSESTNSEGDLAAMLGMSSTLTRKEMNMTFKDSTRKLDYNIPTAIIIRNKNTIPGDTSHLKLLMFRDSYGSYLIPFLNQHFSETVYAWNYIFMDRLIEEEKPDIVVFESLQRFLLYAMLISNPNAVNASARH